MSLAALKMRHDVWFMLYFFLEPGTLACAHREDKASPLVLCLLPYYSFSPRALAPIPLYCASVL
jgi:hypothetical protein